jgi:hypothetical protein
MPQKEYKEYKEFKEFKEFKDKRRRACEQPSGIAWYQKEANQLSQAKPILRHLLVLLVLLVLLHPYELR